MDDDGSPDRLSFLDASVPQAFEVRLLSLPAGHEAEILDSGWRDALVVVERGELDLECAGGSRLRLRSGDVLWLCGLEVRRLLQRGREPTLLSAVARRREGWSPTPA